MKRIRIAALLAAASLALTACGSGAAMDAGSAAEGLSAAYTMPEEYLVEEEAPLAGTGTGTASGTASSGSYTGTISVIENKADGKKAYTKGGSTIDASHLADGYVMVKQTGLTKRLKVQIVMGDKKYNYDLNHAGNYEAFPLQMGDGKYKIRILQNKSGNSYAEVYSVTVDVKLNSANAPFLCPSQYVNYTSSSEAVKKSFDLCVNAKTDTDKLKAIYSWIVSNVSYDYDKASSVKSGYLPSVDSTLSEKKGICFDYAALMACMLRAQGIPAKLVVGTVSAQDMNHAWNEVYLEGKGWVTVKLYFAGNQWKRMDATFGTAQTSEMDSYIQTDSNYTALRIY